ncbi:MAG: hypothetical protein ABSA43_00375 [Candidatus Microgenomates bacterium]|jgi:hypothetical protein
MTADNNTDRVGEFKHREIPSETKLLDWAEEVSQCGGKHNRQHIMDNVRKITQHTDFLKLEDEVYKKTRDYLLPDASWASIPGVEGAVPRDICMDAIQYARIIFYGSVLDHHLNKRDLEEIYKHHCVEGIQNVGVHYSGNREESLKVLSHYVQRIAGNFHATFGY